VRGAGAVELLEARARRFEDAVSLREPDRVPVLGLCTFFPAKYAGVSCYEYCYDYGKMVRAVLRTARGFPGFDVFTAIPAAEGFILYLTLMRSAPEVAPALRFITGPLHDVLGDEYTRWPGRELREDQPFQFLGGKFMKPEEYGRFTEDPVGFDARVTLPRACRSLRRPGSPEAAGALVKAGVEAVKFINAVMELTSKLMELGFPPLNMAWSYSPLDFIGDFHRHVTGALLDVHRRPEEVREACETLVPLMVEAGRRSAIGAGRIYCFIPLHLNSYLSPKLYREFYWEYLRRVIEGLVDAGLTPMIFYEGDHSPHFETLLELPKGKTMALFEVTGEKFRRVRELLRGHTCVAGGVPASLLISGTPDEVKRYVEKLLAEVKEGGGYILTGSVSGIPDEARPENVRALLKAVEEYGRYRR
ncbi:MAG: hypothetical protein J7L75_01210, partial [Thermoproteales archaeon]|nr:hypothetical protein [Thermoproteales archaeon]